MLRFSEREHEVFAVLFLDNRHRLIEIEEMFRGTIDGAQVHVREVVKAALRHNAVAIDMICAKIRDILAQQRHAEAARLSAGIEPVEQRLEGSNQERARI